MKPKIITAADIHLRNDDPYGRLDDRGINDFLILRYSALLRAIDKARAKGFHLVIAGDFLDSKLVDSHTLYYASSLIEQMGSLRFAVLLEGNHGYDDKRGAFSVISHWKHLAGDGVRIVTYPKIERRDGIAYHCIPALSDVDTNFLSIIKKFAKKFKKSEKNILVLHAPITGAKFESGKESTGGIPAEHIRIARKKYDWVVCGDLHRPQVLYDNVYYCGGIMQASLKDKGMLYGYQILNPNNGTYKFVDSLGPRFLELTWEPGKKKSKILKRPEDFKDELKRAVVVVRLIGFSKDIDGISRDDIRDELKKNGAFRVFVEPKKLDAKSERQTIRNDVSDDEMIQDYAKYSKGKLPAPVDITVKKGLNYLRAAG